MCCCMIERLSGFPRISSAIFRHFRKMFGNFYLAFGQLLENVRKEFGNLRKIMKEVVISMLI